MTENPYVKRFIVLLQMNIAVIMFFAGARIAIALEMQNYSIFGWLFAAVCVGLFVAIAAWGSLKSTYVDTGSIFDAFCVYLAEVVLIFLLILVLKDL